MANDDTPFQEKVRKAADGAVLTLVARWAMVAIIPALGAVFVALWNKIDRTAESTARLEEKLSALVERQLPDLRIGFNSRFDAQADRITAHDYRINRLEDWRNMRGTPP